MILKNNSKNDLPIITHGNTGYCDKSLKVLPAIVFNCIKYSKFEISRLTHFCVRPDDFNNSAGLRLDECNKFGNLKLTNREYTLFLFRFVGKLRNMLV